MLKVFLLVCFTVNVLVDSFPLDDTVIEGHVVGGNDTDISKVPYQIVMYKRAAFMCGGFIVSPNFVVTAGHCLYKARPNLISIRAGSSSNTEGGVVVKAKNLYVHPKYNNYYGDYDTALIELATPLQLNNKTIKAIKLAAKEPSADSVVTVSGWGATNQNMDRPKTLQSATYPIYDRVKCTEIYKKQGMSITPRMICAGAEGKSAYFGDSGGALAYKGEAVGIVSFGAGCAEKDLPGVYANIADPEITKFIKETAKL